MGRRSLLLAFIAVALLVTGCTSSSIVPPAVPEIPVSLSVHPRVPPARLRAATPRVPLFPWLVVNEFIPAGSHLIFPPGYRQVSLVETPGAWFPSVDECVSGDGEKTLYHLAAPDGDRMDYVVFLRHNQPGVSRPVFQIRKTLEVLWSPDGSRVAVTIMTGGNYAEVVVIQMTNLKLSAPIDVAPALRGYLRPYLIDAPQFVMALGWTNAHELVLRARGHEPLAPFDLFGYEVLVDTDRLGDHGAVRFLRGYDQAPNPDAGTR